MPILQAFAKGEVKMVLASHQDFIKKATVFFQSDPRFIGLLGAGSMITNSMDEFSDLDFIAVIPDGGKPMTNEERIEVMRGLGEIASVFTGEHVGEPRVIICLYKNPIMHVDLKFITLSELKVRVENPVVLYEAGKQITELLNSTRPEHPMPNLQWIEDRFWVWIHYGCAKLGRGEFFEALDFLSFLRCSVFGPLSLVHNNELPRGVRRVEKLAKNRLEFFKRTLASYDPDSIAKAIESAIEFYRVLSVSTCESI
jgi:hypothetical protein